MSDGPSLVQLRGVSKRYDAVGGLPGAAVLHDVEMDIPVGQTVSIVGPSGSGKSTLLNIIGALDRPSAGSAKFDGTEIAQMSDVELARLRNRDIGFVFQAHHLLPQCTALENVLIPSLVADEDRRHAAGARARDLLTRVGLAERMHHKPGELSGGERQRTAVVRAIINQPRLLLADEPTGALDSSSSRTLCDLLIDLNKQERLTLVVVTHDPGLAARMGVRYEIRDGRVRNAEVAA